MGDAFAIHDVKLALGEVSGDFVFYDLDPGAVAHDLAIALFNLTDAADVHTHGGEEFEGATAGLCLGAAKHDADFFADLIGKEDNALGFANGTCQAAHRLTHHAGLQADSCVAHLPVELVFRNEGGDGVDHDQVDCARADKGFGDVECVLSAFGLRDHKVVEINADCLSVAGV